MLQNQNKILFGRCTSCRALRFKSSLLAVAAGFSLQSLTRHITQLKINILFQLRGSRKFIIEISKDFKNKKAHAIAWAFQ